MWRLFLSLFSRIRHKPLKDVPALGLISSYYNLRRIRFWEVEVDIPTVIGLFALQVCCAWYVGMCLNNGYSLASIISGFVVSFCNVLVGIFVISFLGLKC